MERGEKRRFGDSIRETGGVERNETGEEGQLRFRRRDVETKERNTTYIPNLPDHLSSSLHLPAQHSFSLPVHLDLHLQQPRKHISSPSFHHSDEPLAHVQHVLHRLTHLRIAQQQTLLEDREVVGVQTPEREEIEDLRRVCGCW